MSVKTDLDQWQNIVSHFMSSLFHGPNLHYILKKADITCYKNYVNTEMMMYHCHNGLIYTLPRPSAIM